MNDATTFFDSFIDGYTIFLIMVINYNTIFFLQFSYSTFWFLQIRNRLFLNILQLTEVEVLFILVLNKRENNINIYDKS